jgi:glycine oxidase
MTEAAPDVAIVGGGVIGCAIAYALRRQGAAVTVIERSRVGAESSSAAAGILAPRVHATMDDSMFALAMASHERFPALVDALRDETNLDAEYVHSGVLDVAYDEGTAGALRQKVRQLTAAGQRVSWLDRQDALAVEPGLNPSLIGAFYDEDAYHINPIRFTQALGQAAARAGVRFLLGREVTGLSRRGSRATHLQTTAGNVIAEHVVLAAGAWTGYCSEWAGTDFPIFPAKGQILTIYAVPSPISAVVFGLDAYLLPRVDGTVVVGATVEEVGYDRSLTVEGLAWLLNIVPSLCPALASATFDRAWTGLRPGSPDELPIMGLVPGWDNLTVASGHFRNGIMLAPITGDVVAKLILHEQVDPLMGPFGPGRFANPGA